MEFKVGDKVIYYPTTNEHYAWPLELYGEYEITTMSIDHDGKVYFGVKNEKSETCWYNEKDFINIYEYRKYKLNKLK
jgi:hypothetical protein